MPTEARYGGSGGGVERRAMAVAEERRCGEEEEELRDEVRGAGGSRWLTLFLVRRSRVWLNRTFDVSGEMGLKRGANASGNGEQSGSLGAEM